MKILHTSDWHLGKSVMGCQMLRDQEYFIENVLLPTLDAEKPDVVIIAGDIFDRQVAPVDAVRLFSHAVTEICVKRKIPAAVIAGNHDGADRLTVYSELVRGQGLYLSARPLDTPPLRLEDGQGEVYFHLLPYFDAAQARDILELDDIHGQNAAFAAMLHEIHPVKGARNVLVAHCFAAGSATCESESPLAVGGSEEVDTALFEGFDYVALGHLHGPQKSGVNGAYSGSPLKYSFDEERHKKSLAIVTLDGDGAQMRRIPVTPLHNMRTVTGGIKEIIAAAENDPARDDYIYANLTDTRPVYEPMALLREYYPNMLGLHPGWLDAGQLGLERAGLKEGLRTGSGDKLLFEEFLSQICGVKPQPDELCVFEEMMKKAGDAN
jgi:exonuclease SbcD